jgi:hypothetical protein
MLLGSAGAMAATPTTPPTDLSTLLAQAPGADWNAFSHSATTLVGPFSAHDYAAFLKARGVSPGSTELGLNLYGFTRGFAAEWEQQRSQDLLVERVFEFRDSSGSRSWYSALIRGTKNDPQYTRDIPNTSVVPNSYGAVLTTPDGRTRQYRVDFVKGNLVFIVHMESFTNDLTAATIAQAATEYAAAPAHSLVPAGAGQALNDLFRSIGVIAGVVFIVLALGVTILILLVIRRRRPVIAVAGAQSMSPDGAYWWDGARWRDAAAEAPATAPRSPDGSYWWDGRTWRPIPRS